MHEIVGRKIQIKGIVQGVGFRPFVYSLAISNNITGWVRNSSNGVEIEIDGELPRIPDFRLPEITPIVFGPPRYHRLMRRHLVQRPVCNDDLCKVCGECWSYCPAGAIEHDKKKIHFDYDLCIRCYCCIEVCPHGALRAHETVLGKIARKVLKIK